MRIKKRKNTLEMLWKGNLKQLPLICEVVLAFFMSELIRKVFDGNSFADLIRN